MPSFGRMVADQWRADLQRVARDGPRWSAEHRVLRCRNVADVRAMARSALPRAVFDFVDGGANDELALARNIAAFRDLEIAAKVLVDVSELDLSTTVLGQPVALPILGAPTGLTGLVDPSGERAVAAALHAHGSAYVLSAMASYSIEDMAAAATGPLWFQLYMWRDRGFVDELLARIGAAGYGALVLTVDGPRAGRRERDITNGFAIPPRVTLRSLAEGVRHPRWSARFVREMRISIANTPAAAAAGGDALGIVEYVSRQFDPSVTWDDLARLRDRWTGPLVVKGIMRSDDAQQAVRLGADAVIVSNHGGRQLDDAPGTAQALARIVDAVGGDAEVYLDGGVRRGSDVLKALALGARACLVGRPLLYGLGAAGETGVHHVLALLKAELETALALSGCPSVPGLDRSWLALEGPTKGARAGLSGRAEPTYGAPTQRSIPVPFIGGVVSEGLQYEDDQAVHAQTDAVDWRESYYVNFFDAESDLHGLFWQGVRPNAGFGEACFVLYDGDQELVRSVNMHVPVAADIGEERTAADKQRFECLEPWRHWRASYQDGDTTATVDWHMLSSVCDWQWGPDAKRFEHAGRVHVEAEVGGRSISFDGFGQRDRAWGRRNYSPMTFTWWWVAQFPDEVAVQAFIAQLDDGSQGMMGYLHQDGETRNIVSMDVTDIEMGPHGGPAVAGKMLVVDELGRRLECTGIELMHGLTFGTAPGGSQLEEHDPSENAKNRMYLSFYKFTRADGVVANGMIDNNVLHRPDGDYPTELHFEGESATVILGHGNEAAAR